MTPGDRPHLPLESEPLPFHHPRLAGTVGPGAVQPVDHRFGLEEEPAVWVDLAAAGGPASAGPRRPPDPSTIAGPPPAASAPTPATGGGQLPVALGAAAVALSWVLRRRRPA